MAAPNVAIGRLLTRIRAPDAEAAYATGRLMDDAARRLGPPLDARLPSALAAAGLDAAALLAIPRIALRLRIEGEASTEEICAAWAEALSRAIAAAVPGAQTKAPFAARGTEAGGSTLFGDAWAAETALLLAAARGETSPWWAAAARAELTQPGAVAALFMAWIGRDPARAAARMVALFAAAPDIAFLLRGAEAIAVADHFMAVLGKAMRLPELAASSLTLGQAVAMVDDGAGGLLARLPTALRAAFAEMPHALRPPWIVAGLLVHAPGWAALLPKLLPSLAALDGDAWRGTPQKAAEATPDTPGQDAAVLAPRMAQRPPPESKPAEDFGVHSAEVLGGGLLLLLRPIATLAPEWLALGEALPERLLKLGLLTLRRLAAPLPPASRRVALEGDRPLLALFAARSPPEGQLDEGEPADHETEAMLARLLAAAPTGVKHMPGALRRAYGDRDPFAADAASDALCRLILRPGRLRFREAMAELLWPHDAADLALRGSGWDQDPGWLPWIGRRVIFRFGDTQ